MPLAFATPRTNILVNRLDDFTVSWAQHIVESHSREAKVFNVNILSADTGTTTRVRLAVEHDGPPSLSRRWFVKMPSLALYANIITALPRLLHTEVRFYQDIAHSVPLDRPKLLAAQSQFGKGATLVFSDLEEHGAVPGRSDDALSIGQATAVIEKLARFHACFWGIQRHRRYQWLNGPIRRMENALGTLMAVPLMQVGLRKAEDIIPCRLHDQALQYARNRRQVMRFLNGGSHTLIHRDCHPGNFFWRDNQPGFLDWQLVRTGEGIGDIAYFMATALDPDLRRQHEHSLLSLYRQTLAEHGVAGLSMDTLKERYRAHLSYPFEAMVVTLAIGGMMDAQCNRELIRRATAAVSDLNTFAALPGK